MYRICKTEESAAQQRKIEKCLLDLMQQKSYNDISIGEIAAAAGISRTAFYRYFQSKEGCMCAMLDHMLVDNATYKIPAEYSQLNCHQRLLYLCSYWITLKPILDLIERDHLFWLLQKRCRPYLPRRAKPCEKPESSEYTLARGCFYFFCRRYSDYAILLVPAGL